MSNAEMIPQRQKEQRQAADLGKYASVIHWLIQAQQYNKPTALKSWLNLLKS